MCLIYKEIIINNEKQDSNKDYLYRLSNNWVNKNTNEHPITKGKEELK